MTRHPVIVVLVGGVVGGVMLSVLILGGMLGAEKSSVGLVVVWPLGISPPHFARAGRGGVGLGVCCVGLKGLEPAF